MVLNAHLCLCFVAGGLLCTHTSDAATTTFFDASQNFTNVVWGSTSDTLRYGNYLFTHSLDKWWYPAISLGPGTPTGRYLRVTLPDGLEAQCVTAGPNGMVTNQAKAKITITRVDGQPFDLTSFTAQLLANTAGAGGSFEIMPKLQGEDGLNEPLMFNASGYAGLTFSYQTPTLVGYDTYDITLYVDFALMALTVVDADPTPLPQLFMSAVPPNEVKLYWSIDATGYSLQASPDLLTGTFTNVPVQPVVQGGFYWVTLPSTNAPCFFRLAN